MNAIVFLLVFVVSSAASFNLCAPRFEANVSSSHKSTQNMKRVDVLNISALMIAAASMGSNGYAAYAMEQKIYSSNAKNMARLSNGDSSGGSVYDNNPTSPKARRRRAMVGCKSSSARSLAGTMIGEEGLNEKDCNTMVMQGDGTFMLKALVELDCPTCPYGIGKQ